MVEIKLFVYFLIVYIRIQITAMYGKPRILNINKNFKKFVSLVFWLFKLQMKWNHVQHTWSIDMFIIHTYRIRVQTPSPRIYRTHSRAWSGVLRLCSDCTGHKLV